MVRRTPSRLRRDRGSGRRARRRPARPAATTCSSWPPAPTTTAAPSRRDPRRTGGVPARRRDHRCAARRARRGGDRGLRARHRPRPHGLGSVVRLRTTLPHGAHRARAGEGRLRRPAAPPARRASGGHLDGAPQLGSRPSLGRHGPQRDPGRGVPVLPHQVRRPRVRRAHGSRRRAWSRRSTSPSAAGMPLADRGADARCRGGGVLRGAGPASAVEHDRVRRRARLRGEDRTDGFGARAPLPAPVGGALRARGGRGAGMRHTRALAAPGRDPRARRARHHRVPGGPPRRPRPRRGAAPRGSDPTTAATHALESLDISATVAGYEQVYADVLDAVVARRHGDRAAAARRAAPATTTRSPPVEPRSRPPPSRTTPEGTHHEEAPARRDRCRHRLRARRPCRTSGVRPHRRDGASARRERAARPHPRRRPATS